MAEYHRIVVRMEEQVQTVLFRPNPLGQPLPVVARMVECHLIAVRMEVKGQTALFQHNLLDPQLLAAHMVEFHLTAAPMEERVQTALFQHSLLGLPLPVDVQTVESPHTAALMVVKDQTVSFPHNHPDQQPLRVHTVEFHRTAVPTEEQDQTV